MSNQQPQKQSAFEAIARSSKAAAIDRAAALAALDPFEREILQVARSLRDGSAADRPKQMTVRFYGAGNTMYIGEVITRRSVRA